MIKSNFYYPVNIMGGAEAYEVIAPSLITLPLPTPNPSYDPVAILEDGVGEQPQGMYVMTGAVWEFALDTVSLCRAGINGDKLSVYIDPTVAAVAPTGSIVYLNGQPTGGTDITPSNGVWLVRTPKAGGGGGGAVDSVNGKTGDVTINASNLPGLATVGKTGSYADLLNKPTPYALPIASAAVLGGVKIAAGSKLEVDADGLIDLKAGSAVTSVVTSGTGNSLVKSSAAGVVTLKSLAQGTGVTIVDDGAGNLTVSATGGAAYVLPTASATVLGGVKIGTGLTMTGETLSVTAGGAAVTLTGDVTGSGTGTFATTLSNTGVVAGTYDKVTVDAKGRVTAGVAMNAADIETALGFTPYNSTNPAGYITTNKAIAVTGDATGNGTTAIVLTLKNSGVAAGTYKSVTVDGKGLVTAGTNPTTLAGYGITDALGTGGGSLTGTLTVSGAGKITGLPTAVNPSDAVNLQQMENAVAAAITVGTWHPSASVAATGNHALTGLTAIDGFTPVAGDRVLAHLQTDAKQNGVYVAAAGAWTRAADADTGAKIMGMAILVLNGTANKLTQWVNSNATAPVVGTDAITFSQLAAGGQAYTAGAGLTLNGSNQFSITASGAAAGTYGKVTVNVLGQVTVGAQMNAADITTALGYTPYNSTNPSNYITAAGIPATTLTGDVTGTGTGTFATTLAPSGAAAGTYTKVTVDTKGRVTVGANMTKADIVALIGYTPVDKAGDTLTGAVNWAPTVALASAATVNIGSGAGAGSNSISISGTTTITSFGPAAAGQQRNVMFLGAMKLTHSTAIVIPGHQDVTTTNGDNADFVSLGGSNWKCVCYTKEDGTALVAGGASDPTKLPLAGGTMTGAFNGAPTASIAAAATVNIGTAATTNSFSVTGGTNITSFGPGTTGMERVLVFFGAPTLVHNAVSMQLPGGANIIAAAGDTAWFLSLGASNWKCVAYNRADGTALIVPNTFTQTQKFLGSLTEPAVQLANAVEKASLIAAAPAATNNFHFSGGAVQFHTVAATANWVMNFAFSASTTLNNALAVGDTMTCAHMVTNGATPFLPASYAVDGTAVVPKWQGGTAPTAGNANSIDVYTFTIVKTAANVYTVLAAQTKYA